ncbi:hypothetical protein J4422_02095 [Candidatus Pacearchaeota archaeon]|nr:hypothetical protein [Candidatus Pacearchaeota archaeon]
MRKTLRSLLGIATVGLALAGCELEGFRDVTREEFNKAGAVVNLIYPAVGDTFYNSGPSTGTYIERDLSIVDVDGNGTADIIKGEFGLSIKFVADEFANRKIGRLETNYARLMTPEMREAATRALKADQDLAYLIAKKNYKVYLEIKRKEGKQ